MHNHETFFPGDLVYVIIRNPHAQGVANVQQAAVVQNPEKPNEMALFIHETYYPFTDEFAVYKSEADAEEVFSTVFGDPDEEGYYG